MFMSFPIVSTVHLKQWIEENRHLLKPPVGNKMVWKDGAFIVMVVGGPNSRKDYHYNETPEFYYQVEGDITVGIQQDGKPVDIHIKEGEIFCLPGNTPHQPRRGPGTIGLVIEQVRTSEEIDACEWYCEQCNTPLYRETFFCGNIETDLPRIFNHFYSNGALRTCKACGHVMIPPVKPV
jgi:3-hydroxyanthranilate 3,4-dioxygenase